MRVTDRGMTVDLSDKDPRAVRIRAILFDQPAALAPLATLWRACGPRHRQLLAALADGGEVPQAALERVLRVDGVALRGRLGGISKIARRVGVAYPVRSSGGRRDARYYSLDAAAARDVLKLARPTRPASAKG